MLMTHQLRKLQISGDGLAVIVGHWLLTQRVGQCCGYFLQCVVPEIAFGREIRQASGQPKLVWRRRQLPDLQRELFGYACPDVIGQLTQTVDLLGDWLFLRTPDDLLFLRPNENRTHYKYLDCHNTQRSRKQGASGDALAGSAKNGIHRLTTSAVIFPLCRHWSDEGTRRKRTALFPPSFAISADFEAKR